MNTSTTTDDLPFAPAEGPGLTRTARYLLSMVREHPGASFSGLRDRLGWARTALADALAELYHGGHVTVRPTPEPLWGTVAHRVWAVSPFVPHLTAGETLTLQPLARPVPLRTEADRPAYTEAV